MSGERWFVFQATAGPFDMLLVPLGFRRAQDIVDDEIGASLVWESPDVVVHVYVEPPEHRGDVHVSRRPAAGTPDRADSWFSATLDELLADRGLLALDHRVDGGPWVGGDDQVQAWANSAAGRLSLISDVLRGEDPEAFGRAIERRS